MITAILTALAPIIGPAVAGWFARDWTTKRAAKRKAEAEAKRVEAEVKKIEAEAKQVKAQAGHIEAQAGHVEAQAADVIKGSALDLMLAALAENKRLRDELMDQRARATGYIQSLAHELAERPVQPQVIVVEQDPPKAINGGS